MSGTVTFTTSKAPHHATLSRGRTIYATGVHVALGQGRWQLLNDQRPLHRGRYTLTLHTRQHHHQITQRMRITIT